MKRWITWLVMVGAVITIACGHASALDMDQAKPGANAVNIHAAGQLPTGAGPTTPMTAPSVFERPAFEKAVELDNFRRLSVMHQDQLKIVDSWARQTLAVIRNRETVEGQDPVYSALDMAIRPDAWTDRNIVYVQAIPLREQLINFTTDPLEKDRIMHTGLVSMNFIQRPDVTERLQQIGAADVRMATAVGKIFLARDTFKALGWTLQIVPPPAGATAIQQTWHHPVELMGNLPETRNEQIDLGFKNPLPPLPEYTRDQSLRIKLAMDQLEQGWANGDAHLTNVGLSALVTLLPTIDPANYPGNAKRETELWYNRTFYGTVANVFLYFIAMTLFLMVGVGAVKRLEKTALRIYTLAVGLHLTSMAIRYWLSGRWPTQNQFESVMGAALLGCIVGLFLEYRKKNGLFGMAFSFVGFLATTGCMSAPYFFGREIGGSIGKVAGILQTYWLYIHVNIVISSYALISASFGIALVYLGMRLWYWINPVEPEGLDDSPTTPLTSPTAPTSSAITLNRTAALQLERARAEKLETLDQANMVVLQMAFWFLGIGIICGAVWADQSWGRPWGWDPKETFALVTWIVYLIIVHARFVVRAKGDATAWMSVAGFSVMMFNWIGVNFFLAGLHSYA